MAKASIVGAGGGPARTRGVSPQGEHGRAAEAKLSRRLGGRTTPASGAIASAKGDVEVGAFLVESKATLSDRLSLPFGWLRKIESEARARGRLPALVVQYVTRSGDPVAGGTNSWVMMRERDFRDLVLRGGQDGELHSQGGQAGPEPEVPAAQAPGSGAAGSE